MLYLSDKISKLQRQQHLATLISYNYNLSFVHLMAYIIYFVWKVKKEEA